MKKREKLDTWTITVEMTVFAGDMERENVMAIAQTFLPEQLDGSDYMGITVIDATRDEL